jgi:hypothetical protein
MIPYYLILSEEHPRRLFNIVRLELSSGTFCDPQITKWQDRCAFCAEFQFRKLGISGFLAEWKSPENVIKKMQNDGYILDRSYYFCRKFYRKAIPESSDLEQIAIISEDWMPQLVDQLNSLLIETRLQPHCYSINDPNWLRNFTSKHVGIYEPDTNGIPEFKNVARDKRCGIVIFNGDISERFYQKSFSDIYSELEVDNTTILVIVKESFNDIDSVVKAVRAGAVAVVRKGTNLLNDIRRVISYSAPASIRTS